MARPQRGKREKPVRLTQASAQAIRTHVRDTFARILSRSPDIRTEVFTDEGFGPNIGKLAISVRDNAYLLRVTIFKENLEVEVHKCANGQMDLDAPFFRYHCPNTQLGKLKKAALILVKKMSHREVHDVMST